MASIVLSSVGNSVGNMIMPGVGGRALGFLGGQAGQSIDRELGLTKDAEGGAKLDGFAVQDSKYGLAIPVIYGRARVAGNVIWASSLMETTHDSGGYGKGGGVTQSSKTTYSYSVHCAVALGEGEIGGVQTIWADSKVIYQNGVWKDGVVGSATFHEGSADQAVDPLLESWIGAGNVPAYRGMAYVVIESLQLSNFGNRLPNLSFEILPKVPTGNPEWLGDSNPNLSISGYTNLHGGAAPIVSEAGGVCARKILTCGYIKDTDQARFVVCEVDVTGEHPVELDRRESEACAMSDVASHHWALAPDQRFVMVGFQDDSPDKMFYAMIYDVQARSFGPTLSIPMEYLDNRQIVWLDQQRVMFTETQGDVRGVRVLMRSGMSVRDLGFYDVWGIGSKLGRKVLGYGQFVPCADGFLHITANDTPLYSTLYAVHLSWVNNELIVGSSYILSSGISLGTGNTPYDYLLQTGDGEWSFVHSSASELTIMSFRPEKESANIIRNWQIIPTSDDYGIATTQAPVAFGDRILVVQKSAYEAAYRLSEIALAQNSFSVAIDHALIDNSLQSTAHFSAAYIGADRLMVLGHNYMGVWEHHALIKRRNTGDRLDNVVADILKRAGYQESDFDVTGLAAVPLDGYVISRQMSASSSLAFLQYYEPFDLIENDGQLKAVLRGQLDPVPVAVSEAGATDDCNGQEIAVPALAEARIQELDLPVELTVDALDASRDYEIGSQRARRLTAKGGPRASKLSLPLVCEAQTAKRIAERILYSFWAERTSYRFSLSRRWLGLSPADVITLDGHNIRITEIRSRDGVLAVRGVAAEGDALTSAANADAGEAAEFASMNAIPTVLYLMDLPLLRNEDDQAGLYVAVSGNDGWSGASLWRSADGVDFIEKASFDKAAIAGTAASVLADGPVDYQDKKNAVQVQLYQGSLSSCTEAQLLNGANVALLGGEMIQFQSASLIGPGLYELSGLLRGRQGTESYSSTHMVGEAFVMLMQDRVQFLPASLSERNQQFSFRAVSFGGSVATAQNLSVMYGLKALQPLAPVHIKATHAAGVGSDCIISWVRRARMNAAWVDYIDVPLDEADELYDIEIMDGTNVVRLFENVHETFVLYTAVEQSADWPSGVPDCFNVKIYQRSDRYGRGQAGGAEI